MNVNPLTPITKLNILQNVPLDSSYTDTLDFSSVSAQTQYFQSKAKYLRADFAPIRLQNVIRVPYTADNLYDCNYIMFNNANFGQKWFYAFITKIDFINVTMSEIHFEIDVMQTWLFDYTVHPSMILREHSATDAQGDNLVLEPIDPGEYVLEEGVASGKMDSYTAVIASADNSTGTPGGYVGGMFSGLSYIAGQIDDDTGVQNLLSFLEAATEADKADSIVSIFVMPSDFYTSGNMPVVETVQVVLKAQSQVGNYTPKNKKLLTYPYNYIMVSNTDGQTHAYRYEYFNTEACSFVLECGMSCNPEVVLCPYEYNGQTINLDESMALSGFPQVGYSIDTFRAWLAQNGNSQFLSLLSGVVGGVASGMTGNAMGVVNSAFTIAGNVSTALQMENKGNQARGAQGSGTLVATRQKDFWFYQKHVREDYAKIIDDYFTMYGYACNEGQTPNTKSRPYWNYIQTQDAKIIGSIPFDDIVAIKNCYNNGITFWHGDYVGNYNLNNSPAGGD